MLLDRNQKVGCEAIVDLIRQTVISFSVLPPGIQPPIMLEEFGECEEAVKGSPEFHALLRERGILVGIAGEHAIRGSSGLFRPCGVAGRMTNVRPGIQPHFRQGCRIGTSAGTLRFSAPPCCLPGAASLPLVC